jgi:hypothetical protein
MGQLNKKNKSTAGKIAMENEKKEYHITAALLREKGACGEGLEAFLRRYGETGVLILYGDERDKRTLCREKSLRPYLSWAQDNLDLPLSLSEGVHGDLHDVRYALINGLYGVFDGVRGDLCGVWGCITGVRGDLTGVWGDLTGVWGDLTGVCGDVSNVYGDLSGVRGDVSNARGDLTDVWGDLTGVWGDLTGVCGDVSNVRGRLTPRRAKILGLSEIKKEEQK